MDDFWAIVNVSCLQRLLATDDGEEAHYRSTSSLASQESKDSGRFSVPSCLLAHLKQSHGSCLLPLMMVTHLKQSKRFLVLWWPFTSYNLTVVVYRSEGGGGSSGLRKFESRASLNTSINNESPSLASKFGSSFTVNKHKKVLLFFFTTWDRSMFQWLGSSCDYHFDHQRHSRLTLTHLTNLNLRPKEEKRDFLRFTFISEYHPTTYPLM